ncbi:hypothetical protein VX037_21535 [Gordonia sp. Z-3]|uniref:hypothetical protein n=1 Tax=unclassified Gordonia (in: high G+C Gram-positive bacteria) TaxID=2657482 RepID=UPI000C5D6BA2|nr:MULTISPECIES: hypothetical protein [unclassified Gordonia (in: high G+C Gram-positive bacteria)]MAU80663.1 hypothetical protein [Gordonia sp. (in: high G+C Gram-positive bacteria)]MED5803615.1 hypothetical protein [Gordonia sp. Z-3]
MHTITKAALLATTAAAGAIGLTLSAPSAQAAPQVCPALPGQTATMADCSASSGPTGLTLAIVDNGGTATVTGDNYSGPAAIAVGPGAEVSMTGVRPGLAIGIAGPGATVVVDGKNGPTCAGGPAFAGDFQTLQGCMS